MKKIEIIIIFLLALIAYLCLFNKFNFNIYTKEFFVDASDFEYNDKTLRNCAEEGSGITCEDAIFTRKKPPCLNNILKNNAVKKATGKKYIVDENTNIDSFYDVEINNAIKPFKKTNPDGTTYWTWNDIDKSRPCYFKNDEECRLTDLDIASAEKYAFAKLCMDKGNCYTENEDGEYECLFNKEGCIKSSKQSAETKNPEEDIYDYMEWRNRAGCIAGNESFKKFCETNTACTMGKGNWHYNPSNGKCTITNKYCQVMSLKEENGKCTTKDGQYLAEAILGKTLYRICDPPLPFIVGLPFTIGALISYCAITGECPVYTDVWNHHGDDLGTVLEEKCMVSDDVSDDDEKILDEK